MAAYMVITRNTTEVRSAMNEYNTELVASQTTFMCWHWVNPNDGDLTNAKALPDYLGIVQIS